MQEGWSEKLHEQAHEGCNIAGIVRVNKVVGNIHFSPGRSFRTAAQNIYELVPYLKEDGNRHDFSHTIQTFAFEGDDEFDFDKAKRGLELKKSLGVINPLDGTSLKVCNLIIFMRRAAYLRSECIMADVEGTIYVPILPQGGLYAV